MAGIEQINMGTSVSVTENDDCQVYVIRNETGECVMTSYEIMDGVYVMYDDVHMKSMVSEIRHNAEVFCLDYCYEGRLEWSPANGSCFYQQVNDLSIDDRRHVIGSYFLPLNHYHAITVSFFLPQAQESIQKSFEGFPVDIKKIKQKFATNSFPYLIRNNLELDSIFKDIQNAKEKNKQAYIKIKIFELLLYLDSMSTDDLEIKNEYFYKSHVAKIKKMHEMLINDLEHHYTLEELSRKFDIPLTPMTSCFKGVYGNTIYAYMRKYRMQYTANALLQSDLSVAEAALSVGYTNPSKFSAAFKQVIGTLPNEYRKRKVNNVIV